MAGYSERPFDLSNTNHFDKYGADTSILINGSLTSNQPFFSIIIPTYNRPDLLQEAIESALNQNGFDDFEIVIMDDCPDRDDVTEVLMKNYKNEEKIRYYKNSKNLGMEGNWNRAVELSRGKYIVMLHDDDMLLPSYLKAMYHVIQAVGDNALIFPTFTSDDNEMANNKSGQHIQEVELLHVTKWHFVPINFIGPPIGMCILRDKVLEYGGFDDRAFPASDFAFYLKCLFNGMQIIRILSIPTAFYRVSTNCSFNPDIINGNKFQHDNIHNAFYRKLSPITTFLLKPYRKICRKLYSMRIDLAWTNNPMKWPLSKMETLLNLLYSKFFSAFLLKDRKHQKIQIPQ